MDDRGLPTQESLPRQEFLDLPSCFPKSDTGPLDLSSDERLLDLKCADPGKEVLSGTMLWPSCHGTSLVMWFVACIQKKEGPNRSAAIH